MAGTMPGWGKREGRLAVESEHSAIALADALYNAGRLERSLWSLSLSSVLSVDDGWDLLSELEVVEVALDVGFGLELLVVVVGVAVGMELEMAVEVAICSPEPCKNTQNNC